MRDSVSLVGKGAALRPPPQWVRTRLCVPPVGEGAALRPPLGEDATLCSKVDEALCPPVVEDAAVFPSG